MLTVSKLAVCVAFVVALTAGSASGQALPSDPDAGSPAGTVYELPLDNARQDAAPRRPSRAGGTSSGNGSSGSGSSGSGSSGNGSSGNGSTGSGSDGAGSGADGGPGAIRSENGFGSSSDVPGASGGDAGSDAAASTGSADAESGATTGAALKASDGGPSSLGVYALLAFVLVAGVATGLITRSRGLPAGS